MKQFHGLNFTVRGLSLIGLLIGLAILTVAGLFGAKILMERLTLDESIKAFVSIKNQMQIALEEEVGTVLLEAEPGKLIFKNGEIVKGFRLSGEKPFMLLEKLDNGNWTKSVENIYDLEFKYYDAYNNIIFIDEASERPEIIKKVKVKAVAHNGKEDIPYYVQEGVDLDGQPNNGKAKLEILDFLINVK